MFHAQTKQIEVHYHYVWERVLAGDIDLVYVSTGKQVGDICTKALGAKKFCHFELCLDSARCKAQGGVLRCRVLHHELASTTVLGNDHTYSSHWRVR